MAVFTWIPALNAQKAVKPRVLLAKFGDGYSQRVPDGLNTMLRTYSVQFTNRVQAECDAIEAFLIAQGGVLSFDWTPIGGAAGKWICGVPSGWTRTELGLGIATIAATFEEVPI